MGHTAAPQPASTDLRGTAPRLCGRSQPRRYDIDALDFAGSYVAEDTVLATARARAAELGLAPVAPGLGAALRMLAAAASAKAVVEVGTGTGVSGVWLLRGMRPDGVLTTIDVETEHQRQARKTFVEAGFAPGRTRIIAGRALDVLPRLADTAYDLIFVDAEPVEYAAYLAEAYRLLRQGGMLALAGILAGGRVGDATARDPDSVTLREILKTVRDADEWTPALLPAGDGLLCAVKRG